MSNPVTQVVGAPVSTPELNQKPEWLCEKAYNKITGYFNGHKVAQFFGKVVGNLAYGVLLVPGYISEGATRGFNAVKSLFSRKCETVPANNVETEIPKPVPSGKKQLLANQNNSDGRPVVSTSV